MKIKLVAIAKDESAYIPYWVYHHLHFGFDAIEIHINRCEDNSDLVLDKIVEKYPQVTYRSADWVDVAPKCVGRVIQYAVYSEAYWRTKASEEFTHICFLDLDEFWTPADFKTRVHDCLTAFQEVSTLSFNWLNILNENLPFAPIQNNFEIQPAPTVKSIINLQADISRVQLHLSEFNENDNFQGHFMSDGRKFKHSLSQRQRLADSETNVDFPFYILHRMFRTQMEYVSLLYRGNPRGDTPFKMNRPGFITKTKNQKRIIFENELYTNYMDGYNNFESGLAISDELKSAQNLIQRRSEDAINRLEKIANSVNPQHLSGIKRIFNGLDDSRVKKAIEKLSNKRAVDFHSIKKKLKNLLRR